LLGQPVVELDQNGWIYRAYVYGPGGGQAIAQLSYDGGFYWTHTDHLGSGRKLTNTSGAVVYRGEFDPHGQALYEWQSSGQTYLNSHKYTGYERDWATNLNYAKARTYVHNRGRFMQPDPLGLGAAVLSDPQSLNRYSYVGNDPANFTDPLGLACFARYLVTTTYSDGQVIGERWQFIGIFCDDSGGGYYGPIASGFGGGVGGLLTAEPQGQKKPTKEQCAGIRELLKREKELGTVEASKMSSITFGTDPIQKLNNMHGGIPYDSKELDIDWLMDIYAKAPDLEPADSSPKGLAYNWLGRLATGGLAYTVGKVANVAGKYASQAIRGGGLGVTYPFPFQDGGERKALGFFARRTPYSSIFTDEWMKANCPE
jgi:RHS repeat-associated protein